MSSVWKIQKGLTILLITTAQTSSSWCSESSGFLLCYTELYKKWLCTLFISFLTLLKEAAYVELASSRFLRISCATGESSWMLMECSLSKRVLHSNTSSSGPGNSPDCRSKSEMGSCLSKPYKENILYVEKQERIFSHGQLFANLSNHLQNS